MLQYKNLLAPSSTVMPNTSAVCASYESVPSSLVTTMSSCLCQVMTNTTSFPPMLSNLLPFAGLEEAHHGSKPHIVHQVLRSTQTIHLIGKRYCQLPNGMRYPVSSQSPMLNMVDCIRTPIRFTEKASDDSYIGLGLPIFYLMLYLFVKRDRGTGVQLFSHFITIPFSHTSRVAAKCPG